MRKIFGAATAAGLLSILPVPTTWEDMEATVAALHEAGYDTPIGIAGADKWLVTHWHSLTFGHNASPDGIENVLFGDGEWTDAPFVAAATKLQEMGPVGWFGATPAAIGYGKLMDYFWVGEGPMTLTGPWVIGGGIEAAGDRISDYDVFAVPPFEDSQQIRPPNSIGSGWYIREGSEVKGEAIAFLNGMFIKTVGRVALLNTGPIPVGPTNEALAQADISQLARDIWKTSDDHAANGSVPAFLDTITPGGPTTVSNDGLQGRLLNVMSPEDYTAEMQSAWDKAKAASEITLPDGNDEYRHGRSQGGGFRAVSQLPKGRAQSLTSAEMTTCFLIQIRNLRSG